MKVRIEAVYTAPINEKVDKKIRDKMKCIGAKWYAQGTDLIENKRDICFDLEI